MQGAGGTDLLQPAQHRKLCFGNHHTTPVRLLLEYEYKLLFHHLYRNWSVVCIFHTVKSVASQNVTDMPVSDTQNFGKLTSMRLQWTPGAPFPPPLGTGNQGTINMCQSWWPQRRQQNITLNFYHPTRHSAIFAFMYIIRLYVA